MYISNLTRQNLRLFSFLDPALQKAFPNTAADNSILPVAQAKNQNL